MNKEEELAKLFWDWTGGPRLGGEYEDASDETIAKIHARNFAKEAVQKLSDGWDEWVQGILLGALIGIIIMGTIIMNTLR